MKSLVLFPYTFVLMNWAAVVGLYHFLRGQHDVWSGHKDENQPHELANRHDHERLRMQARQGAAINKTNFTDAA